MTKATIDKESPAYRVAMKWGSNSAFARAIGRTHSTTQKWLLSGNIPPSEHETIVEAARRDGKKLKAVELVDARLFERPAA